MIALTKYIALSGLRDDSIIENVGRCLMRLYAIHSGLHHQVPKGPYILGLDANPALRDDSIIENVGRCLMRLYAIPSGLHHHVANGRNTLGFDANPARYILGLCANPTKHNKKSRRDDIK